MLIWIWVAEHIYSLAPFRRRTSNFRTQSWWLIQKYLLKYLSVHHEWLLHWTETLLAGLTLGSEWSTRDRFELSLFLNCNFWNKAMLCLVFQIVFNFILFDEVTRRQIYMQCESRGHSAAAKRVLLSVEYSGGKIQTRIRYLIGWQWSTYKFYKKVWWRINLSTVLYNKVQKKRKW